MSTKQRDAIQFQHETIEPAFIPYFIQVMKGHQEAQSLIQQAGALRAQADQLIGEANARLGAHNSYTEFLFEKYGLIPGRDRIDPTGRIIRDHLQQPAQLNPGNGTAGSDSHTSE